MNISMERTAYLRSLEINERQDHPEHVWVNDGVEGFCIKCGCIVGVEPYPTCARASLDQARELLRVSRFQLFEMLRNHDKRWRAEWKTVVQPVLNRIDAFLKEEG